MWKSFNNFWIFIFIFKISFEIGEKISPDLIGTVNCNCDGIKGRLKQGNYETIQLSRKINGFIELPNGIIY